MSNENTVRIELPRNDGGQVYMVRTNHRTFFVIGDTRQAVVAFATTQLRANETIHNVLYHLEVMDIRQNYPDTQELIRRFEELRQTELLTRR